MCGIIGQYNYRNNHSIDERLCKKMLKEVVHRGPDDEGLYIDERARIALGHRRLSIIDLGTGHQPMCNEDESVWISFNGEIYNFEHLREELVRLNHLFKSKSDTETIIHGYEEWGKDAFIKLNGMYGFALWDKKERTLILCRDPFGIKPLYYYDDGKTLIFGSEIKSILSNPMVKREVNLQALDEYLDLTFVPAPKTAFANIYKLLPGHMLICNSSGTKIERFYKVIPETLEKYSEVDLINELRDKIFTAIERQMVADVPVGAMLSGGVDSTTTAAIMTNIVGGPIETFTVGFEEDFKYNEVNYARDISNQIGSNHHDIIISADEYSDFLPKSIWHLDEPVSTASTLAFYKVCQLARENVKVVLTGQGADEPFAGYPRHFGERYGKWFRKIPTNVRNYLVKPLAEKLPRNERIKRAIGSLDIDSPLDRLSQIYDTFGKSLKNRLYRDDLASDYAVNTNESVALWQSDVNHLDGLDQMTYIDSRFSLADNLLLYGDKMSMAASIEARVPFLDLELMKFVESIPSNFKIKGFTQKYILKKAVSKWIPKDVIKRKKIGFTTPVDSWFRKDLWDSMNEQLLSSDAACRYYFKPDTIKAMLNDHKIGRHDYKRQLFSLLTFEIWHEIFLKPLQWN